MKKSELKVIIDKVRNRCGLEEPTKVTYDRNDDGQIVFRFYFDSLYLPPEMQFNEPKVLNTFVRKDLYEFKDEFQITKLDKKKGFVEVLPDDQHFKVVKSYKDAKEAQKDEESVHLHDGNRLNENFISDLNLILRESDGATSSIPTNELENNVPSNKKDLFTIDDIKKGKSKGKKVERTREIDIYVFKWTVPNANDNYVQENDWKLVKSLVKEKNNIVLFGYPYKSDGNEQEDKYPSMMTDSYNLIYSQLKIDNEDVNSRFGLCGRGINISKKLEDVKKVNHIYDYTDDDSAMQILKDANVQTDEIEDFPKNTTPPPREAERKKDSSKDVLEKIRPLAEKIANKFTAEIRSKGKAVKQENKDYDKKLQEARTGSNNLKRALDFCIDVYGSDAKFDQDVEQYKVIKSSNLLLAKKYKKIASDPTTVIDPEKEQKTLTNQIIQKIYDNRGLTGELDTNKQQNSDGANGGLIQRNVSIGRGKKNDPKEKKSKEDVKVKALFPDDFYVFCMKNKISDIASYFTNEGKVELVFSGADDKEKDKDKDQKTDDQNKDEKGTENTPKNQDQGKGEKTGGTTPQDGQAQGNTPPAESTTTQGNENQGK